MLEELKNSRQNITFEVFFHLASRKYSAEKLLEELIRFLSLKENENKSRCKLIIRPLIRRIRADDEFYEILKEQLQKGATPTQKSTFSRLITIARGINDIRFWCIEELTNQLSGKISPEVGFDLFYGSSLPVAKTLIDLMTLKVN